MLSVSEAIQHAHSSGISDLTLVTGLFDAFLKAEVPDAARGVDPLAMQQPTQEGDA